MKHLILSFILLFTLASCNAQKTEDKKTETVEVKQLVVDAEAFDEMMSQEDKLQLVDVRTPQEYSLGFIGNAVNYNLLDGTLEKSLINLDKNLPVYVYCAKGGRSAKAASLLEKNGFTTIIDLKGGYSGYHK